MAIMKKLTSGQAQEIIENYTKKLMEQKHISLNKQDFLAIVPLEHGQAIMLMTDENDDGYRITTCHMAEHVYIGKKLKNTLFDPESLERVKRNGNASI